jgi:hypothetical protein
MSVAVVGRGRGDRGIIGETRCEGLPSWAKHEIRRGVDVRCWWMLVESRRVVGV